MTTKVIFETATFADAISKADKIAPNKGAAFDKAAGIVIEITPGAVPPIVIRATNLDVFSMAWIDAVEVTGEKTSWRLPSKLLAQVAASLPIGSGVNVTLEEVVGKNNHTQLHLSQGRIKARFNMMDVSYYPEWGAFDPDLCFPADDLGGRVAQVEWAAAKADPPLSGVYFDGERVISTDRYRLATAPMKIPDLKEPITVPAGILGVILKQTGEIKIGVDGQQLLIMPDEHTQIRTIVFGVAYPKVERIMNRDYPHSITIKKAQIIEVMSRVSNFAGADRYPVLRCFIGKEEFGMMMSNEDIGLLGDVVELPGQCQHPRFETFFTPRNLMEAITAVAGDTFQLHYDPEKPAAIFYLDGNSGYEAWVMPRRDTAAGTA